jgi:hypothetical protein
MNSKFDLRQTDLSAVEEFSEGRQRYFRLEVNLTLNENRIELTPLLLT